MGQDTQEEAGEGDTRVDRGDRGYRRRQGTLGARGHLQKTMSGRLGFILRHCFVEFTEECKQQNLEVARKAGT